MVDGQKMNIPPRWIFDGKVPQSIGVGLNSTLFRVRIEYAELQFCTYLQTTIRGSLGKCLFN